MLAYDSGSWVKLIHLLGVDCPELGVQPFSTRPTRSGILNVLGDGGRVLLMGVDGIVELSLERFMADCRGGEGAHVDDECVPLVRSCLMMTKIKRRILERSLGMSRYYLPFFLASPRYGLQQYLQLPPAGP